MSSSLVTVDYVDFVSDDFDMAPVLEQALGPNGLGIIAIGGVPGYAEARRKLLPLVSEFAELPDDVKQLYELPDTMYTVGWSCGKEFLAKGKADIYKGSYYANPTRETLKCSQELRNSYPSYYHDNIWPEKHLPALHPAFQELTQIVVGQGLKLARHCDRYIAQCLGQQQYSTVTASLHASHCHKARLLHYYAPEQRDDLKDSDTPDDWCGWHTDHGSLTGLTSAMYIKDGKEVASCDPAAGLYIRNRAGDVVQLSIPPTHVAFQVGETLQVMSGGVLVATPHCVRSASRGLSQGASRSTLAVFMQPDVRDVMVPPSGAAAADIGVEKWRPGITFGQFCDTTLKTYYSGHVESAA